MCQCRTAGEHFSLANHICLIEPRMVYLLIANNNLQVIKISSMTLKRLGDFLPLFFLRYNRYIYLGTWNVRPLYSGGTLDI